MKIQAEIEKKLIQAFETEHLEIVNESFKHSVPPDSETHFKVVLVSAAFEGKRQVARHQSVYSVLSEELASGVHALALHIFTPDEWRASEQSSPASPACMGGSHS